MVEKEIFAFSFDGGKNLQKIGSIKVNGGAAGIRTAEPEAAYALQSRRTRERRGRGIGEAR